ncbi:MAG: NAD-dependent epimerase/dehydratase family protein [Candidatus Diapherotrites archaeon]|nr:NAD-dependent epimerase/dehydratase family protein [Candidatus Diapherotrites archaeon]MDZ4256810.1 NAD-dependent epimerase/dehydratase family protein [archaeon]
MKIFLTGSTGMVGKEVMEKIGNKHMIVECAREKGIDILDYAAVEKAMRGCQIVIHTAGEVDESKPEKEVFAINVEGTQKVLRASQANGVKQFIHISSVAVYGETHEEVNEHSALHPKTAYERSKKAGEDAVREYANRMAITIIRPPLIMGPNGYWKQIFRTVKKGFPLVGKGKNAWQMVHVTDLAGFIIHCIGNKKTAGETFILAEQERHTLREVVDIIADIQGTKKVGHIPYWMGMGIARIFWLIQMTTGKKQLLIPPHVRRLKKHRAYDISKAMATGWKPKLSTKEALTETYRALFPQETTKK